MKFDFINVVLAVFAVGVIVTGAMQLLKDTDKPIPVATLQQGIVETAR